MAITLLAHVRKASQGEKLAPGESDALEQEILLMALAMATKADSHIRRIEISAVQKVMKDATGKDLSEADIRVAANSELFSSHSLESALASLSKSLTPENRVFIANGLTAVIKSDEHVSDFELDFFDSVARAIGIRPCELAGLVPD